MNAFLIAAVLASVGAERPNIVLIMADDLGQECLSCYGSMDYSTPNLDRLAAEGVRFANCHSLPLCTPSRVQIMTGRCHFRNYIRFGLLDPDETTFAHVLGRAGYRSLIVGKWQLEGGPEGPHHAGFDEYLLWQIFPGVLRGPRYRDPRLYSNGARVRDTDGGYGPDYFCDRLCEFVHENRERPFFAYFPMCLTHNPFVPTPRSTDPKSEDKKKNFSDMVSYTDHLVGRIDAALAEAGIRNRTLLIFTGDNGTNRQIRTRTRTGYMQGGKGLTIDAGTHVPLIASWPGVAKSGTVRDELVGFFDFLPTFLELTGADAPESPLDGRSFLPEILGETSPQPPREWLFSSYHPRPGRGPANTCWVRSDRWKLYHDDRFFDVLADPLEEAPLPIDSLEGEAASAYESATSALEPYLNEWKNARTKNAIR